jgi:hypothetical protein
MFGAQTFGATYFAGNFPWVTVTVEPEEPAGHDFPVFVCAPTDSLGRVRVPVDAYGYPALRGC